MEMIPGRPPTKGQQVALDAFAFIILEDSPYTYIGKAAPGANTTDAVWRVFRVDTTSSPNTVLYADSNSNYDNRADDMTNLIYG